MVQALFVNSNDDFISRMKQEPTQDALVTASYLQALQWINDANLPLSAIYLNPNDSSYSALRFLAAASHRRPATPVFILDEEEDLSAQNFICLSDKFKLQGVFKGKSRMPDLLKPLQTELPAELNSLQKRSFHQSEYPGYFCIPIIDFIYSKHYPANVFVANETKELRFFAMEGSEVDLEYLAYLSKKSGWLYVEESSQEIRMASFRLVEASYLDPDYLSPSWRTAETFFRAKVFLDEMKQGGVSEILVSETYAVLLDLFELTSHMTQEKQMRRLIEQAKQCDRAIACVTLSALLCKKMKFSKNSIVETLGFASLLQDVSLYQSPFGNISEADPSEMSLQAATYYLNHPHLSADLVARMDDVSDLALQIIRQQHERTDRSGFPSKVGGVQLQPLAEILSLINSYLDRKGNSSEFYRHYSDRVVVPFQQMISALKIS